MSVTTTGEFYSSYMLKELKKLRILVDANKDMSDDQKNIVRDNIESLASFAQHAQGKVTIDLATFASLHALGAFQFEKRTDTDD